MRNLRNAAVGWGHGVVYKVLQAARHFQPTQFMSGYAAPAVLPGQQSALKFGDPIKEWGDPGVP